MAIIWANGGEDGQMRFAATSGASISTSTPRSGARKFLMNNGSVFAVSYGRVDHTNIVTGWVYGAFKPLTQWGAAHSVFALNEGSVTHISLWYRMDGRFEARFGFTPGTVLAVGNSIHKPGDWVSLCMEVVIANSGGVFNLYINGSSTPDISFSGDTQNGANAFFSQTYFGNADGGQFSSITLEMDDLVIQDNSGSSPENARLSDIAIEAVVADGDGDDTAWNIGGSSPAATRWQSVDEIPANDGVDLIESNTATDRNLFNFAAISTTVTVATFIALMMTMRAAKQSATTRKVKQCNKLSGTLQYGAEHTLTTSYADYVDIFHDDPAAAAWTNANMNSAQGGVEVTV